jgi:hypothetical protein
MSAHAPGPQFYAGIVLLICLVAAWGRYVEWRFKNCRCTEKPTLLRPKWRKHDVSRDFDRYDKDGGSSA